MKNKTKTPFDLSFWWSIVALIIMVLFGFIGDYVYQKNIEIKTFYMRVYVVGFYELLAIIIVMIAIAIVYAVRASRIKKQNNS